MRRASGSARRCAKASRTDANEPDGERGEPRMSLGDVITRGWERRAELGHGRVDGELKRARERCIAERDAGTLHVRETRDGGGVGKQWRTKGERLAVGTSE